MVLDSEEDEDPAPGPTRKRKKKKPRSGRRVRKVRKIASGGSRMCLAAASVGAALLLQGCSAVDGPGLSLSLTPIAGAATGLTALLGYGYQVYFVRGVLDTGLVFVRRVFEELDELVADVTDEAGYWLTMGVRAGAVSAGLVIFVVLCSFLVYLTSSVWVEFKKFLFRSVIYDATSVFLAVWAVATEVPMARLLSLPEHQRSVSQSARRSASVSIEKRLS